MMRKRAQVLKKMVVMATKIRSSTQVCSSPRYIFIMSKRYLEDDNLHSSKRFQSNRMDSFRVLPSQHYSKGFPDYKQPVEVNSYSIDGKRQVWFDDRELVIDYF